MNQHKKTTAITIATVFAHLINRQSFELSPDEALVLTALHRANPKLVDKSISEVGDYLVGLEESSLRGLANNVKGIYHELLFVRDENSDGDVTRAKAFPDANHPGGDVILSEGAQEIDVVQLKATDSIAAIEEHFRRYPEIGVRVTEELAANYENLQGSGFLNSSLTEDVDNTFDQLKQEGISGQLGDTTLVAGLVSAAAHVEGALTGKHSAKVTSARILRDAGVAVSASALVDVLFS